MTTNAPATLRRNLKQRHVVFVGLAYMSPFAVFDTFGIVSEATKGHVPMSYIIITIAVLFTAFSYAKMVRVYPSAGSAYTYARRTMSADMTSLIGGASVLALAFLGFDAVTTLSEETVDPRRTVPRAIMWIAALGAAFFVVITYIMQTFVPDLATLQAIADDVEGASSYIALAIGGIVFQTIFLAGATISVLSSGLASQLSASRLLYAMGRDGILARKLFGYVHPR